MIIISIIFLIYFCIISVYTIGWFLNKNLNDKPTKLNFLSVIIAYRNEEQNLSILFQSIENQLYDNNFFEVILVNDNSTDKSKLLCSVFAKKMNNVLLLDLENEYGKKNAINKGIQNAKGNLIILTDADCEHNVNWLITLNQFYNQTNAKMIIAPVVYKTTKKLFSFVNLQALEFLSLMGSTAGSAAINKPIMCNGANLAFEKTVFESFVDPLNVKTASGDDTFLMLNILNKYPNSVKFLKNKNAIVRTFAQQNLKSFYNQRIRWASKTKYYKNFNIYFIGFFVLLLNTIFFVLLVLSFFNIFYFYFFLVLIALKLLVDFPLLYIVANYTENKKLLILSPFLQTFYFIYVTLIGFFSFFSKYKWKNRTI